MSDLLSRLNTLKEKIETAQTEKARLEGQEKELMKRLKEEHGVTTIKAAEAKMKKLEKEADKISEQLVGEIEALEESITGVG